MLRHTKDPDQAPKSNRGTRLCSVGKLLVTCVTALTLLSLPAAATYPPAGLDEFKSAAGLEADVRAIGGPVVSATVKGPTKVRRGGPIEQPDGRTIVDNEIISLELTGGTTSFPITVRENSARKSNGIIRQQTPGVDFPADSFFDIYVEITTPLGVLHNKQPIRLGAVINAIPPLQAQYIPEETFVGVDLFAADGTRVGILRHAAHFVGQHPSFSVAKDGTSGLNSASIFDLPTSKPPPIPAINLGLKEADELDALAYCTDFIADVMERRFSVDPMADGAEGSAVREESDKGEAHGDEFVSGLFNLTSNGRVLDENGDTAPPFPLVISDDVDGLTEPPTSFVDPDGDRMPENPVYFSLAEGSDSLDDLGVGPADILVKFEGMPPKKSISFTDLGLVAGDDVDALCLGAFIDEDGAEQKAVVFSLTPESTTIKDKGFSAADLFFAQVGPRTMPNPATPLFPASSQGLEQTDNLNALKCTVPRVDRPPHSTIRLKCNGEEIDLWGHSKVLAAVGPNGEALQSGPHNLVPLELVELSLQGTGSQGPVNVRLRSSRKFPNQPSRGIVQDMADGTPEIVDVGPWGKGEASYFLDLFVEIDYNGQTLHHGQPIRRHGIVTELPPRPEEVLQQFASSSTPAIIPKPLSLGERLRQFAAGGPESLMQRFAAGGGKGQGVPEIPLFTEDGQPSGLSISDVIFWPNLPLPTPIINAGGIVSGASFQQGAAPDAIMSIFGTDLAGALDIAETIPLPTTLSGTTVTVTDRRGNQAIAALSPDRVDLSSLSSLFAVSPLQINFLIPGGIVPGVATVTVTDANGQSSTNFIVVSNVAPALFSANQSGSGVAAARFVRQAADGSRSGGLIYDPGTLQAIPLDLGPEGDIVFLELFGTGMRRLMSGASATIDGEGIQVFGPVFHSTFEGLDQANIGAIPRSLIGAGEVEIVLTVDGLETNTVTVTIQ